MALGGLCRIFTQNILESVDEERISENEDKDLYPFKEALKRLYNLDKLYKDMPKLYYNTGEVIEVTKQDILKYINSSRSI